MKMKILILGGTQFVSKRLAKSLIEKGHSVSIFTRGRLPVDYDGLSNHFIGDRRCEKDIFLISKVDFDIIFDISAYTVEDIKYVVPHINRTNLKKYIFCSTGAVYADTTDLASESSICSYNENWGSYGVNKHEIELYLEKEYHASGFPVCIVRPTYIYGPQNNLYREMYFMDRISSNQIVPIPNSKNTVQFIYIDDLIEIFEALMLGNCTGEIFNVTNSEAVTWEHLVLTIADCINIPAKIKKIDSQSALPVRSYFPYRDCTYRLSMEKMKSFLLPVPSTNLTCGIKKTYDWYLKTGLPIYKNTKMTKIDDALAL